MYLNEHRFSDKEEHWAQTAARSALLNTDKIQIMFG